VAEKSAKELLAEQWKREYEEKYPEMSAQIKRSAEFHSQSIHRDPVKHLEALFNDIKSARTLTSREKAEDKFRTYAQSLMNNPQALKRISLENKEMAKKVEEITLEERTYGFTLDR